MEPFAELVEQHQRAVFGTLARLLGAGADLEDLAQEVFLRLFRGLRQFRGEAQVSTFLYRIVVNVVNDELRRRQRARQMVSIDDEASGWKERLRHPGSGPAEALERGRFLADIEASLGLLSPRERTLLVLYFQEERSYQELSDILGLPMGTVKTHLFRTRQKLKAAMKERMTACPATV